ncbi:hypothetical protein TVAG_291840 [Trichomonas vaginalis G3]|uniref:Uncharacterized protein n=1 Tax=Trichomonas vaginalis (strain ATCC PRA-98 / G3) TaxID=412133 RepID=A2DQW4_TRIV3|nr:hypothetical protein TVAGG3_0936750 [Trichomonas vaginalis G3]EAY17231.1 hypothetical protein TVAG_291840 [Trichomonas vaginalis G3]KAI5486237.1 hypothetical protein TVAGG3_0936750 [Trichomonas vaginalis G3]|eukprot:XP_001329454.1 hypothetical protein [Trichomonas vaginalis G3]
MSEYHNITSVFDDSDGLDMESSAPEASSNSSNRDSWDVIAEQLEEGNKLIENMIIQLQKSRKSLTTD